MRPAALLRETLAIVLAGGQGERLYPLTKDRSKPSVPFGGLYRIVDFTLSNCINSGLRRIYVLTQYSRPRSCDIKLGWNIFRDRARASSSHDPAQLRVGAKSVRRDGRRALPNIYTLENERPRRC
jgi:glucose-1-phosphate adenylyltransferase